MDRWIRGIEPPPRTVRALDLLATSEVDVAAEQLGITGRHLRRILLDDVGLAPKAYQRVVRLQRFLQVAAGRRGLATAAAEAGYADQSHLSRETRALTALTPSRLLEMRAG